MHHIDGQKLEEDVKYRFKYLTDFMEFGEEDARVMKLVGAKLAPLIPVVVDAVYNKLFSFDITKHVFLQRNHGFEGNLDDEAQLDAFKSAQIHFRKDMLSTYFTKLFTRDFDASFVAYLDYVGKIHTDKAGSKAINVDYVHVNALFGYVSSVVFGAIPTLGLDKDTESKAVLAINKVLWIQNDLFVRHYMSK